MPSHNDQPTPPARAAAAPAGQPPGPGATPPPTRCALPSPVPLAPPSRRALGLLIAAVFAVGLIAGAALAPAPSSSLAANSSIVERVIALLAANATHGGGATGAAPATSASTAGAPTSANTLASKSNTHAESSSGTAHKRSSSATPSSGSSGASSPPSSPNAPSGGAGEEASKPSRLPPIQHVWSIELAGSTFAAAQAAPANYPYLVGQLIPKGTLLTSYTALDAYELAGDATLLPGGVGATLNVIAEPACPAGATSQHDPASAQQAPACPGAGPQSGAAGSQPGAAGAQPSAGAEPSAAETDAFLQRVLAPILASPAYGENGLIVISFASLSASEGTATTSFSLQPTAGALLLSPLLHEGAHSAGAFDSLSPRASVAAIFEH